MKIALARHIRPMKTQRISRRGSRMTASEPARNRREASRTSEVRKPVRADRRPASCCKLRELDGGRKSLQSAIPNVDDPGHAERLLHSDALTPNSHARDHYLNVTPDARDPAGRVALSGDALPAARADNT